MDSNQIWLGVLIAVTLVAGFTWLLFNYAPHDTHPCDWDSHLIVLTGGSNGVGRCTADLLLRKSPSLRLVVIDRESPDPAWMAAWGSDRVFFYQHDLAKGHSSGGTVAQATFVDDLVKTIIKDHGIPHVVINNAGTVVGKYLTELDPADIGLTISVNLIAPILLTRAFLPYLIERNRGHFIHIASACGLTGLAWLSDYCSSKFGLVGFNESLRQELRYTSVNTSVICPGHITTKLFANVKLAFPFILPSLKPELVAENIIYIITSNKSNEVWIPLFTWSNLVMKAAPTWFNDFGHALVAANDYLPEEMAPMYGRRQKA